VVKIGGLAILSKAILFFSYLGRPSIRTLLALFISIAFLTDISDGTILL
jgi:phosphatidylglycerophosphate synthase